MKQLYPCTGNKQFSKIKFILLIFLFPLLLHAQINKVTLTNIQACGGATLIPNCYYTGGATPVTVYYERLVGADVWQLEGTQEYNAQTSYVQYNGNDLLQATTFRVRALDEITGTIYISNSVSVDPAKWDVDRGTSFATAFANWGSNCSNGYIAISIYRDVAGRPPYTIDYKKSADVNYTSGGETLGYFQIDNIEPHTGYNIRITDKCGKVSNLGAALQMIASADITQPTSACTASDGIITVSTNSDSRYSGVAPFTFSVHKYGSTGADTAYVNSNVFKNLPVGTYEYGVRDACGDMYVKTIVLGSAAPDPTATYSVNSQDSCYNDLVIHATGAGPFQYAIKPYNGSYASSSDSVFKVSQLGYYYYKVTDACNSTSTEKQVYVTVDSIVIIDSTKWLNPACVSDLVIYTSGKLAPYKFYLRDQLFNSFQTVQTSDTFHNVMSGRDYELLVEDRCGRQLQRVHIYPQYYDACTMQVDTLTFESKNSTVGCADISGKDWIDVHDDDGYLIYSINPNGNAMNNVCWGVHVEDNEGDSLRSTNISSTPSYFLDRNFYIEPPANITLTDSVSIRLYVTGIELYNMLNYLSNLGLSYDITNLKILKKKGSAGSPVDLFVTDDSTANMNQFTVITPQIVPFGPGGYYLEFKVKDFSEFNPYMDELAALPLQLLSFGGTIQDKKVQLNWQTSNEINTKSSAVQWSATGNSFTTIGQVNAMGKAGLNNYSFIHTTPNNGNNFYRLQQMDKDGKTVYSKIININFLNKAGVVLSPNPAHDILIVTIPQNQHYSSLCIYDITGKKVVEKTISSTDKQASVAVNYLPNGVYVIKLNGAQSRQVLFLKH